jgi:hypothetical protein
MGIGCPEGKAHPFNHSVEARRLKTGFVTDREERQAGRAEGTTKVLTLRRGQSGVEADRRRATKNDRVGVAFFKLEQSTLERSGSHQQKPWVPPRADCARSPRRGARDEP